MKPAKHAINLTVFPTLAQNPCSVILEIQLLGKPQPQESQTRTVRYEYTPKAGSKQLRFPNLSQ